MNHNTLVIGHTSGIGESIYECVDNASGVSKSTGFDITTDIAKTYNFSDYKCILLNAVSRTPFSQIKCFFDIINNETVNKDTLIIVLSSSSAYKENLDSVEKIQYSSEKMAINKAVRNCNNLGYKTVAICPSYVDTEWNKSRDDVTKLDVLDVAATVLFTINSYFEHQILINEIQLKKVQ